MGRARKTVALIAWIGTMPRLLAAIEPPACANETVRVAMDTAEADAVLAILQKERANEPIGQADWDQLFGTPGYERLSAREAAMKRPFTREDFQSFVRSPELLSQADTLAATLGSWKKVDLATAASRALTYLPAGAHIEATVFPVIKPKSNSFVFDQPAPSIFLALDPSVTPNQLSNTLAHELHHIGFASACPPVAARAENERQPSEKQDALKWLSAFGEGFAMLAAAGGPDIHPHAVSKPGDRARWDRDLRHADRDLRRLDRFFRDILEHRLTTAQADEHGFSFFGVQGPWYTVGYRMVVTIERAFGREEAIRSFCDVRRLPETYNRAADRLGEHGARWSSQLLRSIRSSAS